MDLPATLTREKNKLRSKSATIWLIEAAIAGTALVLRYAHARQDIVWRGNTYKRSSFRISGLNQSTKGKAAEVTIAVSNVDQAVQAEVEQYNGLMGSSVTIYLVSHEHLSLGVPMSEALLEALYTECNLDSVVFHIGAENFYNRQFPADNIRCNVCGWWKSGGFKGPRCLYEGSATSCDGTFNRCIQLGNQARYDGAPGLVGMSVEVDWDE